MTKKEVEGLLSSAKYTFAKTMLIPHSYTHRNDWESDVFNRVVGYIRKYSIREKFFGKEYNYYYLGEYKYWTMGNSIENTLLINRAYAKKDRQKRHFEFKIFSRERRFGIL